MRRSRASCRKAMLHFKASPCAALLCLFADSRGRLSLHGGIMGTILFYKTACFVESGRPMNALQGYTNIV